MSSNLAKSYHSMTFTYAKEWDDETKKHGTVNTWDDWHLIPTSRPVFNPPSVKTVYIDIPGSNGSLDMTEALAGYPLYNNREGSLEFIVANGYRPNWIGDFQKYANWLHGKELRCVLDDDPSYYYEGRFTMNNWKSNNDGTWSNVTFDYNVKPYKYSILKSTDNWLWDPFNFDTDFIPDYPNYTLTGTTNIVLTNHRMPVIPTFYFANPFFVPTTENPSNPWANQTFTLSVNDVTVTGISPGMFRDPRIELVEGENIIRITGYGTCTITYRMGSL